MSVDPLAANGGQERHSPYAAMGNQPEFAVDPEGLKPETFQYSGSIMAEPDNWANLEGRIAGLFKDSKSIFGTSGGGGGGGTWDDQSFAEHMQNVAIFRIFKFIESLIAAGNGGGLLVFNFGDGGGGKKEKDGLNIDGEKTNSGIIITAGAITEGIKIGIKVTVGEILSGFAMVAPVFMPLEIKGGDLPLEMYHGNDKRNKNPHSVYMIYSTDIKGSIQTEKYGITGKIDKPENRPQYQVNKFNNEKDGRTYQWMWVQTGIPGNQAARWLKLIM